MGRKVGQSAREIGPYLLPFEEWMGPEHAHERPCYGLNFFFSDSSREGVSRAELNGEVRTAKRLCGECPFKQQCLAVALPRPWVSGIWGGTTRHERGVMRRQQKQAVNG